MSDTIVINTPEGINMARLLVLRSGLKLEIQGLHRHGRSIYSICKSEFGFKGSRERVLDQLNVLIEQKDKEFFEKYPKV